MWEGRPELLDSPKGSAPRAVHPARRPLPPMNVQEPPTPEPGDAELLGRWRGGDPSGFELLVRRYEGPLLRHARTLLRHGGGAEDTVQEAFLRLAKTPPDLEGREDVPVDRELSAWLHRVTRNLCLDVMRSEQRRRAREAERASEADAVEGREVEALDTRSAVEHSISSLPDDQREVVSLRLLEECSYAEIASITGRNVGTVGWLISVGMKALARDLSPLMEP